jgi:general secretion pathway protein B
MEKPIAPALPEALPAPPVLKVTGIGWQKDNADRLAIVNGKAVSEGAVVEGARVEEIFPDRVRFSFNDKAFEIPLGKIPGGDGSP